MFEKLLLKKHEITLNSEDFAYYQRFTEIVSSVINKYSKEKFEELLEIPEF